MPTGQQRRKHQITYLIHQVSAIQIRFKIIDAPELNKSC